MATQAVRSLRTCVVDDYIPVFIIVVRFFLAFDVRRAVSAAGAKERPQRVADLTSDVGVRQEQGDVDQSLKVVDARQLGGFVVNILTDQRIDEDCRRVVDEWRLLPAGHQQVAVDQVDARAHGQSWVVWQSTSTTNELIQTTQQPAASYLAQLTVTFNTQPTNCDFEADL